MEEILRQLGELALGSVPTIVIFILLYSAYRILVHKPLERVLAERRARTEGALEKARADIAAAEARTAHYEQAIREARVAIFKAQEARRKQALALRAAAVAEARSKADQQVVAEKALIEQEVALSKVHIQADAERLAKEVISAIFRQVGAAQHPAGGGQ